MPVFAVLTDSDDSVVVTRIKSDFANNHYKIAETQWLVDANETAKSLAEKLGLNEAPTFVIFKVDSYFGNHVKDLWDWLELPRDDD